MMPIARPGAIAFGTTSLTVPAFFPSVSSVKTTLEPSHYVALLHSLRDVMPLFLVSAFDLREADAELARLLDHSIAEGVTVLMDSGNYESYWKSAREHWAQHEFHEVLARFPCTLAFSFDEQAPPEDVDAHVELVVQRWRADQEAAGSRLVVPIVHGVADALPTLCARIASATRTPLIAVAERRLGDGVLGRLRTVEAIRAALGSADRYVGLHLLGTGNPLSIALYASCGADSFDGLEWCQTSVDHETALLHHLSHADFFRQQTSWGDSDLAFQARTLAHNLEFYASWMSRLQHAVQGGSTREFCRLNFPLRIYQQIAAALDWEDER
jgi:queuine/archaeosine tRNA-ribosyltransferase